MCLILFAYKSHPQYKLILAANRDEFYKRPSKPAEFWQHNSEVLAGIDLEKGGTWLGINRRGMFGAVTNYRDNSLIVKNSITRGNLVKDYLLGNSTPLMYLEEIRKRKNLYNPFNLLIGDVNSLLYYSKVEDRIRPLRPGMYGLSNGLLDTCWPKVERGKEMLKRKISTYDLDIQALFNILFDKHRPRDEMLPDTGIGLEWERLLSSIFIESKDYGTRACTLLLINKDNHVIFVEKSLMNHENNKWQEVRYEFDIF